MADQSTLLPACGLVAGLLLLGWGFLKRVKTNRLAGYRLTPTGQLRPGERQLVSGPAAKLGDLAAPVSKRPCVFYREETERLEVRHTSKGSHTHWVNEGYTAYGGFRLDDGSGGVLVFPSENSPDFSRPAFTDDESGLLQTAGDIRRTEEIIQEGDKVTVVGVPVTLAEVLAAIRGGARLNVPTDVMAWLLKLEKDGGAQTPCFFGGGAATVADLGYEAYLSETAGSARFFLQAGGVITILSAAALLYVFNAPVRPVDLSR